MYFQLDRAADDFLKLEKYVNLNFTGFHKILKKHDKCLPNPCKAFYISRLHDQNWVRGDYSDVIVILSRVYSAIRGDEAVKEKESEKQVILNYQSLTNALASITIYLFPFRQRIISLQIGFLSLYHQVLGTHGRYLPRKVHPTATSPSISAEDDGR